MSHPPAGAVNRPTVLVVEDDDSIRMLVKYSLEGKGYKVLAARNGDHALEVVQEYQGIIDILVTDLIMPGLSGTELAEKLHVWRPYMKILLMSGNSDSIPDTLADAPISLLAKPFSPSQLLDALQTISQ